MIHSQTYYSPIWVEWLDYCEENGIRPVDEGILEETGIIIK
jgi:hypothetical protein